MYAHTKPIEFTAQITKNFSFDHFFQNLYLPYIKSYKKTFSHDKYTYYKNLSPYFGSTMIHEVKAFEVDGWIGLQVEAGYANSTIIKHLVLLKRMMRVAVRWELIPNDNAVNNHRKISLGDLRQRFLTPQEVSALISCCYKSKHPFLGFVVELLILTGARCGEIRLAKWCHIDMQESALVVPISKSGKRRVIYLSEKAKEIIIAIRNKSENLGFPMMRNSYLIKNPKTGKPYNDFQVSFAKARSEIGIEDVRIHDLRHTYASILIQNGVTLYEVQKLLGHSSPNMTQRYAHLNPNNLRQIVNNLPGLF